MASKKKLDTGLMDALGAMDGMEEKSQKAFKTKKAVSFKKPRGDYYSLDLVVRDTVETQIEYKTKGGRTVARSIMVQTEGIKRNYKEYLERRAGEERTSITKYIHSLIEEDMRKRGEV